MAKTYTRPDLQIRWMIRRDVPEVLDIEFESFEDPWTEQDLLNCLSTRNCIGMVAVDKDCRVVGYMVYELLKDELHVRNLAVAQWYRHRGVGKAMADKLYFKLKQQKRKIVTAEVRETNLVAQKFFASQGFKAIRVSRGHYESISEDAYCFERKLKG